MLRFVLAILLVTCYNSLGNPVSIESKQISTSIVVLENNCRNDFLKKLLHSKINECSDSVVSFKTKTLQCLMFYDMSAQLCTAETTSGITLNEDYSKINEVMDVNSLCETAKDWVFTDLPEYHGYQDLIQKIHKHSVSCGKICGSDELTSEDANFYCKFYKWGWDVIKNHTNAVSQDATNVSAIAKSSYSQLNPATSTNKSVDTVLNASESLDISIKNLTSTDIAKETSGPMERVSESNNIDTKQIIPAVEIINKTANHQIITDVVKTENTQQNSKITVNSTSVVQNMSNPSSGKVATEVQNKNASTIPLSSQGKEKLKETPADKDSVLENPKDKGLIDSEHYGDEDLNSEDRMKDEEGNEDLQGEEDGGDPMINDNVKPLEKKTEEVHKLESIDSTFNKEISQRDFFSGNAQDVAADDDDDDHFFTFFLTAVVLVVLLYILYHDKSKISKLFFGLLVEGRQNGRRRNSRGHAYRRLDTLEQAISTNTAAPPSKIIY